MTWVPPTVAEFKSFFQRDFSFAPASDPTNLDYVTDADLLKVLGTPNSDPNDGEAMINFNSDVFGSDAQATKVFMYLAAFTLVFNLQNSAKGISSQSKFPISSNSVGGVSVNFQLPERYARDPYLSQFTANGYGMRYLSLALPYLIGNVAVQPGMTTWWPG